MITVEKKSAEGVKAPLVVAGLSADEKRLLLAKMLREKSTRSERFPLSFSQQRLWFLDRLEGANPAYNVPLFTVLKGTLDEQALAEGLREIVRRHEILRARFETVDDQPVQVIDLPADRVLAATDLTRLVERARRLEVDRLLRRHSHAGFDLERGPLFRFALLRLAPAESVLILVVHHTVTDGWSMGILLRELVDLYQALTGGAPSPLSELPIQYVDYAVWQRRWFEGNVLADQLAYWKAQLEAGSPVLELPTDRPRPAIQSHRGRIRPLRLPERLLEELRQLGQQQGATLFMTLLAAFKVLLYRYSGQPDLSVGVPIAARNRPQLEPLIGLFVNTLVLRTDLAAMLSRRPTFCDLLARVREVTLGAYDHQDVPFEKLVDELKPERSTSHSPLFQVMFILQNTEPLTDLQVAGLSFNMAEVESGAARFDLTFELYDEREWLTGSVQYNSDLFDRATISRLIGHYLRLLRGAADDPGQTLSELPWLGGAERHQLLFEWDDTRKSLPTELRLERRIKARLEGREESVALGFGSWYLSAAELDHRADRLARRLVGLGVGPTTRVGLRVGRSPEMVIAVLGILKSGGAYVPMDPSYPRERLDFMVADSQVAVLVVDAVSLADVSLADPDLEVGPECPTVVRVDRLGEGPARPAPVPAGLSLHPAYVIYTSGSTGRPKGVQISHHALVNFLRAMAERPGLVASDVLLSVTSLSFDIAALELYLPLLVGARIELAPEGVTGDGAALGALLVRSRATVMQATPTTWQVLVEAGWHGSASLKALCGGEPMPSALAAMLRERAGSVWNVYGPTETTVWSTTERLAADHRVSIGRAIDNTVVRVAGGHLEPLPIGVAGELWLGGEGLARGYLSRPGLTADRFVPDIGGRRQYRTGDRVRWLADGRLEFFGRLDHQIKLRGHRIELGEIESVLSRQPSLKQAVVVAKALAAVDDTRLVAYVVGRDGGAPGPGELRSYLAAALPDYMVPSHFVELSELPLTPNGKVDRKALPEPEAQRSTEQIYTAPRTPLEEQLAMIWSQVLGVDRVGAEDHFFQLGGHSLLATQVISRVDRYLGVELPLRALFEAPRLGELANRIGSLRLAGQGGARLPLERVARDGALPLSFSQLRQWFLDRWEPGNPAYNLPTSISIKGGLDEAFLVAALGSIQRRHESLRTRFVVGDDEPIQVIESDPELPFFVVDLRSLADAQQRIEARRLAALEAGWAYDLSRLPLFRSVLLRLGEARHQLFLTHHHIISDGWSMRVMLRELTDLYQAMCDGQPLSLSPSELPIQYADYAAWQRRCFDNETLSDQLDYWHGQLSGSGSVLDLPTDRPRPAVRSHRGQTHQLQMPGPLLAELRSLSRQQGVTTFMTLLAAFKVLLHRYSGQTDLSVGVPIAYRNRPQLEPLIGFFVNTLVLRTDLATVAGSATRTSEPTFEQLLKRIREVTLGAYDHQDVPFEKLVDELQPERSTSHTPLFQVMFILQNTAPLSELEIAGLTFSAAESEASTARFDLTLELLDEPEWMSGSFEYSSDLFDRTTISRLTGHYLQLLRSIANDADRPLDELPWLGEAERHQLLHEWDDTRSSLPEEPRLERWIQARLVDRDEAVVLGFGSWHLSAAELARQADDLARRLIRCGVGPETRVGLRVERSPEMMIAVLGILKSGGAYVPMDPSYPQERLDFMVADSQVSVLVTDAESLAEMSLAEMSLDIPEDVDARRLRVVRVDPLGDDFASSVPVSIGRSLHPAYVIYTSGSTGRPKGVQISHQALVNFLQAMAERPGLEASDVLLSVTSLSFDIVALELYLPLLVGARVELASAGVAGDGAALAALLARSRATVMQATPTTWQLLLESGWSGSEALKALCGGEALPSALAAALGERCATVWNVYGPTETTVWSTVEPVAEGKRISIGRAIGNTSVRVVDERGEPLPIGVSGELWLGGEGLARGYLSRPGLTAERFVPATEGRRLYRTGDQTRWLADGRLEFFGRLDHQIKLRGHRIELGEIESVLGSHPRVARAVVVARALAQGRDLRLVAYFVAVDNGGVQQAELRESLTAALPDYMVPSHFMELSELPLTANGKVDRKALPEPAARRPEELTYTAPRTPLEEQLAMIWSQVLGVDRVGTRDHFFHLGGHSLLAAQVISRVDRYLDVELPLQAVFEAPTLKDFAARVEASQLEGGGNTQPAIQRVSRDGRLPLSFSQLRQWFLDQWEPGTPAYNLPAAIRVQGGLEVTALAAAFSQLVRRHESLRTCFVAQDGNPEQRIENDPQVPFHCLDLRHLRGDRQQRETYRLAENERRWSFDLSRLPLFRATLIRLEDEEWLLMVTVHHIVIDGWSFGILFQELTALYEALESGMPFPLPPLPLQYADYAAWQRGWLQGEVLEAQLNYWRQELSGGGSPLLELPTDRPRPPIQTFRGGRKSVVLPRELTDSLRDLGTGEGATLFMVLLAALDALLYRYTSQTDLSTGTFVAGRKHEELERVIGFFVNSLVLRVDLSGRPSFRELLARIRQVTLGAYAHQDVPFETLLEELHPERDLSRTPLFQTMMVLQNLPPSDVTVSDVRLEMIDTGGQGRANFDLTLWLTEVSGGYQADFDYNLDLFDLATVERLIDHFTLLLRGVTQDSDRRLSELLLMSGSEARQMMVEWNPQTPMAAAHRCVQQHLETWARETPNAEAVRCGKASLSYRELNERANRLAHLLRRRGVGPERVVGICLERSLEMVVAVLGVLKASGAYLPLDPELPSERLRYLLADAKALTVLTREGQLTRLLNEGSDALEIVPVLLDRDAAILAEESSENPVPLSGLGNLAYIIYTSGSTGRPKGVAVEHRSLLDHTREAVASYDLDAEDRLLQFASLSFDASAEEIFPSWLAGSRLVLRTDAMLASGGEFLAACQREGITVLNLPTAYWHEVVATGFEVLPSTLRVVVIGGEKARADRLASWRQQAVPAPRLFNTYGPTEATVVATRCELTEEMSVDVEVPIGRALDHARVYVLDRELVPMPMAVAGELHIAGSGLARGYLRRPGPTAERFIPDPFGSTAGERLYKSGDRARWRLDGLMECLGRLDSQIKIRGYRIEPGEIEAALQRHPEVREVVAAVRREEGQEWDRLVAWVAAEPAPSVSELRAFLKERLPDYMVPSAFITLAELPKTTAGKVDRRTLPEPDRSRPEIESRFVAPSTASEEVLADMVRELLSVEKVGIYDSFFDLGGHSLLATQFRSRIRSFFEVELPLQTIFENPTVAALAVKVEGLILAELEEEDEWVETFA